MKPDTAGGLGLDYKVLVYETVDAFNKAAVDKDHPTGRAGACLDCANTSLVYRGGCAGSFRRDMVDALVKLTGFARTKTGTIKNKAGEAKDVFEGEEPYMKRFRATAAAGQNPAFVKAGFTTNEEQCEAALQQVADKLGPYTADASSAVREGGGKPKKVPAKWVAIATSAYAKDKGAKTLATLSKENIAVAPFVAGQDDANVLSLAKGIWAREQRIAAEAEAKRVAAYA